jgi:hypothetical protein
MNSNPEDNLWHNLVVMSAPAYADAAASPPYGFTTRLLARLQAEERQQELMERIGLRAIFASLGILALTAAFTFGWGHTHRSDLEPGLGGILQSADVPLS